jgi:hypothetical protein
LSREGAGLSRGESDLACEAQGFDPHVRVVQDSWTDAPGGRHVE